MADREVIGRGYRSPSLLARIGTRDARHQALERLCAKAEQKPRYIYDARSKAESTNLPDERLDAAIVEGISKGYITPEVLADYFGDLFALYRAMMPSAADATYLDTARETAEAIEAISVARVNPTPENCTHAAREELEASVVLTASAKQLLRGTAA
jgi:hypothetical protein